MKKMFFNKKGLILLIGLLLIFVCICFMKSKERNEYTVTFDTTGGTEVESQTIKEGEKVVRPQNPTRESYDFVEWQLNGKKYNFDSVVKADITLKAIWNKKVQEQEQKPVQKPIPEYKVTFDSAGGTKVDSQTIKEGEKVVKPKNPTKENYDFVEWQLNGKKYNFDSVVKANITLKAIWNKKEPKPILEYTVNFDTDGGTQVNSQTVKEGEKVVRPENPTKAGYDFISWQLNGQPYNFDSVVNNNITLKATWIKQFSIGEEVIIENEKFNVISIDGDYVKLFARYNINLSGRQTSSRIGVFFASSAGWNKNEDIDIYQYGGDILQYIDNYVAYLKSVTGDNQISGTLITTSELYSLGCSKSLGTCQYSKYYYSWLNKTQPYWVRTSHASSTYVYSVDDVGNFKTNSLYATQGVRPVIIISKSTAQKYC